MQTIRHALRSMRHAPGIVAAAVISLTLGLGATVSIFSIIDALKLRELPVKDPDRLVIITDGTSARGWSWNNEAWVELRRHSEYFDSLAAWSFSKFNLAARGEARYVDGLTVSGSFLGTLGVPTIVGRPLRETDDRIGGNSGGPVAVISYGFWQAEFASRSDIVGQVVVFNDVPFTIVGVTPAYFFGPEPGRRFDIMIPIAYDTVASGVERLQNRGLQWLTILARLKSGQSIESVSSMLRGIHEQVRQASMPDTAQSIRDLYLRDGFLVIPGATGYTNLRTRFNQPLLAILALVVVVQLIGSANVANMMLARAAAREYEFSLRVALGASRFRVLSELLVESFALAALSALGGIVLAHWAGRALVNQIAIQDGPVVLDLQLDWRVVGFAVVITVATALLFGVAPAMRALQVEPMDALNGRGRTNSARTNRQTAIAVIGQVALSVVAVVAAALFSRTFMSLMSRGRSFDSNRVLLLRIAAPRGLSDPRRRIDWYEHLRDVTQGAPNVATAALSPITPGGTTVFRLPVVVSGGMQLSSSDRVTWANIITPEWFDVFSVPVRAGRRIAKADRAGGPVVAVVNQAFARRFLASADPIGHTIQPEVRITPRGMPIEIVGVVQDVPFRKLQEPLDPIIYMSLDQLDPVFLARGLTFMNLLVRSNASAETVAKSVTTAIAAVDPTAVFTARPLSDQIATSIAEERVLVSLSVCLGLLGLILAIVGLYGITAYVTVQRRNEFAVRLALGGTPVHVVWGVLRRLLLLLGAGLAAGAIISVTTSRIVQSLLVDVDARDPVSLVVAGGLVLVTGMVAGLVPALHASRIEPAALLREQ
jgi:putative ABC transport system permease protein